MCGRTSLFAAQSTIERRFDAEFATGYEERYNISPKQDLHVIHDETPQTITSDEWGFVPTWAESPDTGPRPINARVETVSENRLFRDAFESRRALVLADGYYEWAGDRGGKQPYRITRPDDELFAMAGLWSRWEGANQPLSTVTILTTEATARLESIHDRMPVVLDRSAERSWLDGDPETAQDLLETPEPMLQAREISTLVNDPTNDSPAVVEPVGGETGQTDLGNYGAD
ncbi:SOS response-associated peptidase [Halodesulfurarchaeum sp. HSR-GB]|uniref:SOS response-associated peptidase n=1 Tax=Halodesulfurarchaeum sp. HSR-GB TaxID=3074077 RepID=UPI002857DDA0|nr:SOS response-associated peptidase [Halodesulfurarchaeum sp. HSR-GB]MDR5656993.1 SOS response-associated peptidase [Halodesulfurarchaeum sp. HSR-GB]